MKGLRIVFLIFIIVSFMVSGCAKKNYYNPDTNTQTEDTKIEIKAITLEQSQLTADIGETMMLNATVSPEDARNMPIKWTSSNDKVISVNKQGVIYAREPGKAVITVSDEADSIKASCEITVNSLRKAVISDNVPTQSLGGAFYKVSIDFENCSFPSFKIIADCGGGSIKTDTDTIKLGAEEGQYQITGKATISFGISSYKQVSHMRILCFDNGELFDCKEYNVSLVKPEEPKVESSAESTETQDSASGEASDVN